MKKNSLQKGLVAMVLATSLSSQVLTSVSAVTTSAQTESVATASTKTADATKNVADTSKDTAGKVDPRGLDLFVWGTTSYSGSAVNGLTINNSVTSGTLSLQLDIQSLADISWKNNSSFAIKLPDEFAELSKTEAFKQSLSGSFKFTTFGIGGEDYTYRAADVTVENNQIVFRNPDITGVFGVLPHVKMIVNMDLGKAVTQSGVRIANARNMSYYDFQTALNSYGNIIDWNLGSTNSHAKIPVQKMDPGFDDTAPEIRTEHKNLNVELNSVYNDTAALKDITVYDKEDGYINNKLIVESNQVDTSREGDYDVTYSATDSIGIKTVKTLTMHVKKTVPETSGTIAPKDYTVGEQNITGSFTGDVSQIELYVNGIRKSNGGSFSDGKFIYNVGDQNLKSTDHVTMNAYDRTGKILQKDVVVNVKDVVTVGAIAPNDYTVGDSSITGNFTGDVKQIALYINGNRVSETGPFSNGRFTYNVSEEHIKATDKVTMNAYDQKGKLLQKDVVVHVKNKVVVTAGTITPSDYTVGQTEVKGQYTGDVAKARVSINGVAQAWGGTFKNGTFSYYVGVGKIKAGDRVTITAYDKAGKALDQNKQVKVIAPVVETKGTITPSDYTVGQTEVKGHYTGDVAKARVSINGVAQAWGGTFKNGTFSYYVGANKIKATDRVTITAYDKAGKALDQNKQVKVINNEVTQGTITPAEYLMGSSEITGRYTGAVAKARVSINGIAQGWGGTFTNGSFSYYISAKKIKATDNVTITAYDKAGKVLDLNKKVAIKGATVGQGTITPAEYAIGDTEITGTYTGAVAKARINIDGKEQAIGGSFNDNHFSYYVGSGKIKANSVVTITAYDKSDNVLDQDKKVTIQGQETTKGTITANKYALGDSEITGRYTGAVAKARISINGKEQAFGGSFNGGNFSYYVGANKIKSGDRVTITAYDAGGKVLDKDQPVSIAQATGTITPDTYYLGLTTIRGSYTGDIVRARIVINGEAQGWGGTFQDGKFEFYVGSNTIKDGDSVRIAGYDQNDKEIASQKVNVMK